MIQTKELNEYYFNMEDRLIKLELITQLDKQAEGIENNSNLLKKYNNIKLKWDNIVNAKENIMVGLLNNHYKLLNSSVNKVEKPDSTKISTSSSKTLEETLNTSNLTLTDKYSELKNVETNLQKFLTQLVKIEQFEKYLNTEEFNNLLNLGEKLGSLKAANKEQLGEVSEIRFKMNLILDAYNQSISAISELFIYFNDMLNRLESQVNLLEKINNDQ